MSRLNFRYTKNKTDEPVKQTALEPEIDTAGETEIDTAGETETFWTRNVRLLTFLICTAVFLAIFGPISIFHIKSCVEESRRGDVITAEEVLDFADRRLALKLSDFKSYEKTVSEGEDTILYTIKLDQNNLVMVGAADEKGTLTCFTVSMISSGETVDVLAKTYQRTQLATLLGR